MRYKGAVISATPPTTSTTTATGVWTLVQQMQAQGAGTWPVVIGAPFWIGTLGDGNDDRGYGIVPDSGGNVYIVGQYSSSGNQLVKYNISGTIQWQKTFGAGGAGQAFGVAIDSSNNIYVVGAYYSGILISKWDSSGTLQWQKNLGSNGPGRGIAVDSSANIYVIGNNSFLPYFSLAKYDSSGTIQWQRSLGVASRYNNGMGIAFDLSGNIYVIGDSATTAGTSPSDIIVAKYNNSGTIQWQRKLYVTGSSYKNVGQGIATDSSSNVYIVGTIDSQGSNQAVVVKYNTSGAIQWQRNLGIAGDMYVFGITVDTLSNVYVTGYSGGGSKLQIAKYNSSGTIQWQRTLGNPAGSNIGYSISVDAFGNVYVSGSNKKDGTVENSFLFAKLPSDGSLTGTYAVGSQTLIYAASSLADSAASLTDTGSSLTDATSSFADTTPSLTYTTSTLTSSVKTL